MRMRSVVLTTVITVCFTLIKAAECSYGPYIQICRNCQPDTDCMADTTGTPMSDNVQLAAVCNVTCQADADCVMSHYIPADQSCTYHNCDKIIQAPSSQITFRGTSNPECLDFEIFTMDGYRAGCNWTIGSDQSADDVTECIPTCADMASCSGVTFSSDIGYCQFHNCSAAEMAPGHVLVKKRCLDSACSKIYIQTCLNCHYGASCQSIHDVFINRPTVEESESLLQQSSTAYTVVYNYTHGYGFLNECSKLRQQPYVTLYASRKTCSQECSRFRLFTVGGAEGQCAELEVDLGGVDEDYCVERCLDMDTCRAVSYHVAERWCKYHTCTESQPSTEFKHIRRECVDTTVSRHYTQTCWNCDSPCQAPIAVDTSVVAADACSITCPACQAAKFVPASDTCLFYQCDEAIIPDMGTVVHRKTSNPDCLEYELFGYSSRVPTCAPLAVTSGARNVGYCVKACLDMPGCRGTVFQGGTCSFYNCTTTVDSSPNFWIEKTCKQECNTTVQTCQNCRVGTECPSPILSTSGSTSFCLNKLAIIPNGYSLHVPTDGTCAVYSCRHVTQQYQSVVYRTSCDQDCPFYELYEWNGQEGKCPILHSEFFVALPQLCTSRCLDMPGCRAVTYNAFTCTYHTCDCSDPGTNGMTFYWRYCLPTETSTTIFPSGNNTAPEDFPKASQCGTSTITSVASSTATPSSSTALQTSSTNITTSFPFSTTVIVSTQTPSSSFNTSAISASATMASAIPTATSTSILIASVSTTTNYVSACTTTTFPISSSTSIASQAPTSSTVTVVISSSSVPILQTTTNVLTPTSTVSPTSSSVLTATTNVLMPTPTPTSSVTASMTASSITPSFNPSASVSISTPVSPTSTGSYVFVPIYLTPCFCTAGTFDNKTNAEIIAEIRAVLTVDPRNTSLARRRLTCAEDDRTSSQLMGVFGSVCLAVTAIIVTGTDFVHVIKALTFFNKKV